MIQIEAELLNKFNLILEKMIFSGKNVNLCKGVKRIQTVCTAPPFRLHDQNMRCVLENIISRMLSI